MSQLRNESSVCDVLESKKDDEDDEDASDHDSNTMTHVSGLGASYRYIIDGVMVETRDRDGGGGTRIVVSFEPCRVNLLSGVERSRAFIRHF
jgi:hypothetical protein